jgi:hypothetical protein
MAGWEFFLLLTDALLAFQLSIGSNNGCRVIGKLERGEDTTNKVWPGSSSQTLVTQQLRSVLPRPMPCSFW